MKVHLKVHKVHNFHQVRGGGLTGGTGLIPRPIAAAHVRDLRRKGGKSSRSLCMKTSEQKSLSPRTNDRKS